jgi:hypothetical protein
MRRVSIVNPDVLLTGKPTELNQCGAVELTAQISEFFYHIGALLLTCVNCEGIYL